MACTKKPNMEVMARRPFLISFTCEGTSQQPTSYHAMRSLHLVTKRLFANSLLDEEAEFGMHVHTVPIRTRICKCL